MKRFFIAALTLAATIPAAINLQAQDDDIYFSKKADKKAKHEAIYAATADNEWSTNANNDWNLDDYNRRGKESSSALSDGIEIAEDAPFYYNIINEKGDTVLVPGTDKILKGADVNGYKIVRDTVVLVEQYRFTDLIRRFHNPFFGYYRYSPWYDVAYYDPFYWDYCYYDPWWYVTPSFGFHWGSWYGGWSYGYYSGWYGGWYSPFYAPMPHYHDYCYHDHYHYDHSYYNPHNHGMGSASHGAKRNNFGGHFAHRGGWKGDGGSSRLASASSNRSYRAANGARTGLANNNGTYTAGPTLRGRNTSNGRLANSNMRNNLDGGGTSTAPKRYDYNGVSGSSNATTRGNNSNTRPRRNTIVSSNRGFTYDNSSSRRSANTYTPRPSSNTYERSNSYSSHPNNTYSRGSNSSSSYSGSSNSYSSGSSYSSGGGHSSSGSFSGGGSAGSGRSGGGGHGGRR